MTERNTYKSSNEFRAMSNSELADYLDSCNSDYDGTSRSVREAVTRLLRAANGEAAAVEQKVTKDG